MKKQNHKSAAFSLLELLVVIAIVLLLASVLLPGLAKAKAKAPRIMCLNNLEQIGIAYRVWSTDHNDLYPSTAPYDQGGFGNLYSNPNQGVNCWRNFSVMHAELGESPKVLICPADERLPATNFIVKFSAQDKGDADFKGNLSLSYFVGVNACDYYPQSFLGGDRNLAPGLVSTNNYGFSLPSERGNDVFLQTNTAVCWSQKMHSNGGIAGAGNVLLSDGSVQQASSSRLRTDWEPFAGVSSKPYPAFISDRTNEFSSFRLLFP